MEPHADNEDIAGTLYEDMAYQSEEEVEGEAEDGNDIVQTNVVKRGITRLHKFRNEHGKGVKIALTIDDMGRISGSNRIVFASFLGDLVRERIGLKVISWKKVELPARDDLWSEITVRNFLNTLFNVVLNYAYAFTLCPTVNNIVSHFAAIF